MSNGNGNGPATIQERADQLVAAMPSKEYQEAMRRAIDQASRQMLRDEQPRDRFEVYGAELALVEQPPVVHIVKPIFSIGSVSLLVGAAKRFKTWVLLHLLVTLAAGLGKWFDFESMSCPVLFVDEESGKPRVLRRLYAIQRGLSIETPIPLYVTSLPGLRVMNTDDLFELRAIIRKTGAKLIGIDAMIDIIRDQAGDAENSSTVMGAALHALREIANELDCAFVILHHENKMGGYRGSTALEGIADLLITVKAERGTTRIEFDTASPRDFAPIQFAADITFDRDKVTLTTAEGKSSKHITKSERGVLEWLEMTPGRHTLADIGRGVETTLQYCKAKTAENAALDLAKIDYLKRTLDGGVFYELTDKGKASL